MKKTFLNIFLVVSLVFIWGIILYGTLILWLLSDAFQLLGNGVLIYIFGGVYALAFILPLIFRKRILKHLSIPLALIISTIIAVIFASIIFLLATGYISSFSREKWDNNERLRHYMIEDLENKHKIIGKTKEEIIDIIGEPSYTSDKNGEIIEYYIGFSMIDPIGYEIQFENNIATKTTVIEH